MARRWLGIASLLGGAAVCGACVFDTAGLPAARPDPGGDAGVRLDGAAPLDGADLGRKDGPRPGPDTTVDGPRPKPDTTVDAPRPKPDTTVDAPRPKPDTTVDMPGPTPDSTVDTVPPAPTCDKQLASKVPGYHKRGESSSICQFYYSASSPESCAGLCAAAGLTCDDMKDNDPGTKCAPEQPNLCGSSPCTCNSKMVNAICTCLK